MNMETVIIVTSAVLIYLMIIARAYQISALKREVKRLTEQMNRIETRENQNQVSMQRFACDCEYAFGKLEGTLDINLSRNLNKSSK